MYIFQDCDISIFIQFRMTVKVFGLTCYNSKSRTFQSLIWELLYTDEVDFIALINEDMEAVLDLFSRTCTILGLTISLKKMKIIFTLPPGQPYVGLNIFVQGTRLDVVDSFVYFGSTLSRDRPLDSEMNLRIENSNKTFRKLESCVWFYHVILIKTKLQVYETCILLVFLNTSETLTP